MSKARQFIKDCTRGCSNELCAVEDKYGKKVISYHEWLTPEQALRAVEIAKEEMIDTLEVKEVDLDKEVANWWKDHYKKIKNDYKFEDYNGHYMENSTIISLAQYFFELGLKAKGE